MTDVSYERQLGFFDPEQHRAATATLVGCGGVGSFSAIALSKLGIPSLTLIDFDEVEAHNIPNQFFEVEQIGSKKCEALAALCERFGNTDCHTVDTKIEKDDGSKWMSPVVLGLDSMDAREAAWSTIKRSPYVPVMIDVRLSGQSIVMYSVDPCSSEDIKQYENTLHADDEANEQACTERGVIDVGFQVGSLVSRMVRKHYASQELPKITMFEQGSLSVVHGGWVEEV